MRPVHTTERSSHLTSNSGFLEMKCTPGETRKLAWLLEKLKQKLKLGNAGISSGKLGLLK